ncbi:MAG TPA: branched-chain amino acid transaminase [Candidatus Dormibacteraeota bacterium]|nr:branched-chain amino acid transaminase [Candidatus Dormibacteraeota bacterium]
MKPTRRKEEGMARESSGLIWMNGTFVPYEDAKIHVLSHVVHYGSSVFEGIRAYATPAGTAIFRLDRHVQRMLDSCKIARITCPYGYDDLMEAIRETVRKNGGAACYIRPVVYRGFKSLGVNPTGVPIDVAIATLNWGKYLGKDALDHGISVRVASWNRQAPNTFPAMAKTGANYLNSQLIKLEAVADGYEEGIALDVFGYVAEGSGENIFLVRGETLYTPTIASAILPGVTRDCILTLGRELGLEVREEQIPRELLYISDELFFTGTAAEITPITQVDRIPIGTGAVGPVTRKLQKAFFDIIEGRARDTHRWLFPVEARGKVQRAAKKAR